MNWQQFFYILLWVRFKCLTNKKVLQVFNTFKHIMESKGFESSDTDDSDFKISLQHDLSDDSLQSEYDSAASDVDNIHESNHHKKKKKNITNPKQKPSKYIKKQRHSNLIKECDLTASKTADNTDTKDEKERADSLWKNFLSDTATSTNAQSCNTVTSKNQSAVSKDLSSDFSIIHNNVLPTPTKSEDMKSIVANEIIKGNAESSLISADRNKEKQMTGSQFHGQKEDFKRRGITSVLSSINKKSKLSTLEKSKLDWNQFKEENNLKEEISNFNRGKNGYLEKQDFLLRIDSRQFEIEKKLRNKGKR